MPGVAEAYLSEIRMPTPVLAMEQDAIHPAAHAERLAAPIPDATLGMLPPKGVSKPLYLADFHAALNDVLRSFR